MHKSGVILASALTILAVILAVSQTESPAQLQVNTEHKLTPLEEDLAPWEEAAECTWDQAIECATAIKDTVLACSKAFETKGSDIVADIKCVKSLLADKKLCWPCICAEAEKKGWKVIGC